MSSKYLAETRVLLMPAVKPYSTQRRSNNKGVILSSVNSYVTPKNVSAPNHLMWVLFRRKPNSESLYPFPPDMMTGDAHWQSSI